jgi:hypothetical protein
MAMIVNMLISFQDSAGCRKIHTTLPAKYAGIWQGV